MSSIVTINRHKHGKGAARTAGLVLLFVAGLPLLAHGEPGRRGPPGGEAGSAPHWIIRERHELRRDVLDDGRVVERHRVMREQWQQVSPEERQRWMEQRRQLRQLSPEERQQLRRDILEAYKLPRE